MSDVIHLENGAWGRDERSNTWQIWFVIMFADTQLEKRAKGWYKRTTMEKVCLLTSDRFWNVSNDVWAHIEAPVVKRHVLCLGIWLKMHVRMYICIYMYARIKRALRTRTGLQQYITESYYKVHHRIWLRLDLTDHTMVFYYGIMLWNQIKGSKYGIILQYDITES